jgi:hypothetical protein
MVKKVKNSIDLTAESLGIATIYLQELFSKHLGLNECFLWEEIPDEHLPLLEVIKAFLVDAKSQFNVNDSNTKVNNNNPFELVINISDLQQKGYSGINIRLV